LVLAGAVVAGVAGLVLSLVWPPSYEAAARLLVTKLRPSVTLDPRFPTLAEENVVNLSIQEDQVRRQTLVGLAQSADLMLQVVEQLGDSLAPAERTLTFLSGVTSVRTEGNLITLSVRAGSPAKAVAIANAWAGVYQTHINRLYSASSPSGTQIQAQLAAAEINYEAAKTDLEVFLRQSQENEWTRQIDQKKQILADLQKVRLDAVREEARRLLASVGRYDQLILDVQSLKDHLSASPASAKLRPGEQFALFALDASAFGQELFNKDQMGPFLLDLGQGWLAEPELTAGEAVEHLDRVLATLGTAKGVAEGEVSRLSQALVGGGDLLASGPEDTIVSGIATMQAEINDLQARLEREQITREDLTNSRDVAQESYLTLTRKAAEVQISSELTSVEVQMAAPAQPPEHPAFPRPLMTTVLGVLAGGLAGLVLAFVVEAWPRSERQEAPVRVDR